MSTLTLAPGDLFYFGPPGGQLYGALHESQTYAQREYGIVICYPFGQEYIRSHRACRHLAAQLARAGFPTLRFDYGATGDSAGEAGSADLDSWRDDISRAVDTLRDRTGVESICLLGLRLGASLALEVAVNRDDVSALILWEPIINGRDYLKELAEQHQEVLWRFFDNPDRLASSMSDEYLGFPIRAALREDLEQLNLLVRSPSGVDHALIVESQASTDAARLHDLLREEGIDIAYQQIPSFATWREDVDKGLVPDAVLRGIVSWAEETLP